METGCVAGKLPTLIEPPATETAEVSAKVLTATVPDTGCGAGNVTLAFSAPEWTSASSAASDASDAEPAEPCATVPDARLTCQRCWTRQ